MYKFKTILTVCVILSFLSKIHGQSQLVSSADDVFVNIDGGDDLNGIFLVVDNSNDDAVIDNGGMKIISEGQYNILKWNIADQTGNYVIPFSTGGTNFDQIPIEIGFTIPGDANGSINFATYGTGVNNLPLPEGVTNINHVNSTTPNDGEWVYDRYWFVDANSYSLKPEGEMNINYISSEMTGNLIPNSSSMVAQQYDTIFDAWGGSNASIYGSDNLSGTVSDINLDQNNFTSVWTLVELNNPLPVELVNFEVDWGNNKQTFANIRWNTASELNNDYFDIQRSLDGITWEKIDRVYGQGTTNTQTTYKEVDNYPLSGVSYYRLKQVDFNGKASYSSIQSLSKVSDEEFVSVYPNPASGIVNLKFSSDQDSNYNIALIDKLGRKIETIEILKKQSIYQLNLDQISSGVYTLIVNQGNISESKKLIIE